MRFDRGDVDLPQSEDTRKFVRDVLEGLERREKSIPARWLYDARGSDLFEEITQLGEYYPTRTERKILAQCVTEIAERTIKDSVLIEFGSGSSVKTEILLSGIGKLTGYVPIDVSASALKGAVRRISKGFPHLPVQPIVADFMAPIKLASQFVHAERIGFFPGSTIGNFAPTEAEDLLRRFGSILGSKGRLIIGVDLQKEVGRLEAAYDDSSGVTAQFNLNLLRRINRELDGNFDLSAFQHRAFYNTQKTRIEMHLVSRREQSVSIAGRIVRFKAGESIHTENSYKYTVDSFCALAAQAGWRHVQTWTDPQHLFSVHEFSS